jgi:hypothetical protein
MWQRFLQSDEALHAKDTVVEIRPIGTIHEATVRMQPRAEKVCHELSGLTEYFGCKSGDLQHFETKGHERRLKFFRLLQ